MSNILQSNTSSVINRRPKLGQPLTLTVICLLAVAVGIAIALPGVWRNYRKPGLAEALNNVRQVKFALDGFASDFDGQFPNADTAEQLGLPAPVSSTDFFRQLFLTGKTRSEKVWARGSLVASRESPDDRIMPHGVLDPSIILEAGDVHWAYMIEQTNTSTVTRPLLCDPFIPGTGSFDLELYDRKVVVLRIDGSAKALRARLSDDAIPDSTGENLFSPEAKAWEGSGENPRELLVQPEPARKP